MSSQAQIIASTTWRDIDDPILAALERSDVPPAEAALRDIPPRVPDRPFDLEVAKPRAISVERLYQLLNKPVPADVQAALGATVPILLAHGMTPFYKAGHRPSGVWGQGYQCTIDSERCDTVSLIPESRKYDVIHARQTLTFGLTAGGQLATPPVPTLPLGGSGLTIDLAGATLSGTTDQQFAVALNCTFSVLEVQAGPIGAGGARWNLYRGRESIDTFQPLFQTLLVPRGTATLRFTIDTWVRGSGRFFGLVGAREWVYPPVTFDVSLES